MGYHNGQQEYNDIDGQVILNIKFDDGVEKQIIEPGPDLVRKPGFDDSDQDPHIKEHRYQ